jgi:hypothetical protein
MLKTIMMRIKDEVIPKVKSLIINNMEFITEMKLIIDKIKLIFNKIKTYLKSKPKIFKSSTGDVLISVSILDRIKNKHNFILSKLNLNYFLILLIASVCLCITNIFIYTRYRTITSEFDKVKKEIISMKEEQQKLNKKLGIE